MNSKTLDDELIDAARDENLQDVQRLLKEGADPLVEDSLPLWWAAKNNNKMLLTCLLPVSDASAFHNEALRIACKNQHWDICRMLLPTSDPVDQNSVVNPLFLACKLELEETICDYIDRFSLNVPQEIQKMKELGEDPAAICMLENVWLKITLHTAIKTNPVQNAVLPTTRKM